jgi:hypothetical protein
MMNPNRGSRSWKDVLLARSQEAAAWRRISVGDAHQGSVFRSEVLRLADGMNLDAVGVETVVLRRRQRIGDRVESLVSTPQFVVWLPDQSLSDGAAQLETNGYFDADNQPPWDTWVAWVTAPTARDLGLRNMLIAWVPDDFLELVRAGVDANPEECLLWLQGDGSLRVPGTTDRFALMESGAKCSWDLGDDVRRSR